MADLITTAEAAEKLGITSIRVRQLIASGRLPAKEYGQIWLIKPADLAKVRVRKTGRPRGKQ
jgi:excisionase family DNA binding protein